MEPRWKRWKHRLAELYWQEVRWRKKHWNLKYRMQQLCHWLRGIGRSQTVGGDAEVLILCAHPDDETIFFSSILEKDKPYVVCMSGRGDKVRSAEFAGALAQWQVQGAMLNMPDVPNMIWIWKRFTAKRLKKLRKSFPNVTKVYTHSISGETEHPHHHALGKSVCKVFGDCRIYTTAAAVDRSVVPDLEGSLLDKKGRVMKQCYPSQVGLLEKWSFWWDTYFHTEHLIPVSADKDGKVREG